MGNSYGRLNHSRERYRQSVQSLPYPLWVKSGLRHPGLECAPEAVRYQGRTPQDVGFVPGALAVNWARDRATPSCLKQGLTPTAQRFKIGDQRGAIGAFAKPVLSGSTASRVTCWASAASCLLCSASVSS